MKRVIVGVTGATGTIYGVRLMELMRTDSDIEIHLVMSRSAKLTLKMEHDLELDYINDLAHEVHEPGQYRSFHFVRFVPLERYDRGAVLDKDDVEYCDGQYRGSDQPCCGRYSERTAQAGGRYSRNAAAYRTSGKPDQAGADRRRDLPTGSGVLQPAQLASGHRRPVLHAHARSTAYPHRIRTALGAKKGAFPRSVRRSKAIRPDRIWR